jgi:uncharacterized protein YhhL (DUF1145 family)
MHLNQTLLMHLNQTLLMHLNQTLLMHLNQILLIHRKWKRQKGMKRQYERMAFYCFQIQEVDALVIPAENLW